MTELMAESEYRERERRQSLEFETQEFSWQQKLLN